MPGSGVKATTPKSAALLSSNLAANGKHVGYAAYTTAVLIPDASAVRGGNAVSASTTIESEEGAQIKQIRWVQLQTHELLVMATTKSVMIYTADGARLIHVVTAPSSDEEGAAPAAFRGIGSCAAGQTDYVCVGVSTGAVCLVPLPTPLDNPIQFGDSLLSPTSEDAIVDVSAGQASDGDPSRALVCSADGAGQVLVHALESDGAWQHCCAFNAATHDATPSLCTVLRMRGTYLFAGYASGHIRIFDLVSCTQTVQIAAHARWINALEVHPNGALFASASEDTTVALWEFVGDGHNARHVASIPVQDALLTGVAFCGGADRSCVCANAYDQPAVHAWKLD